MKRILRCNYDDKIVWIKPCDELPTEEDWIKTIEGEVHFRTDKKGNNYAIIEGTYIPGKLIVNKQEGQKARFITVLRDDGRWSAISQLQ